MPLKKTAFKVSRDYENQRLDQVLASCLPPLLNQPLSKSKVRKLIIAGAVYLNRKRVRIASKELRSGSTIEVYLDWDKLNAGPQSQDRRFVMSSQDILFEDDYLIAVNKPPGIPTQPTLDEARDNLFAAVKKFLAARVSGSPSDPYLGLHHRLDRDTSGVLLFTKSPDANPGIASLFSQHQIEKVYQALAIPTVMERVISSENSRWSVKNYLGKGKEGGKVSRFCGVKSGGLFAHTDFQILQSFSIPNNAAKACWVEARPHTGRTHQIRVHLSEYGMPLFGDVLYGGPTQFSAIEGLKAERVMLHAVSLTFIHPIHKNNITIRSSLPEDFNRCLEILQTKADPKKMDREKI